MLGGIVASRRSGVVMYAIGILALVVTLLSLGKNIPIPNAPHLSVALDGPTGVDSDGRNTIIVDNAASRVLMLNSANQLIRLINFESPDSPIDAVTDVCVTKGTAYVAGVVYESDNDVIKEEKVLAYGLYNAAPREIYHVKHDDISIVPEIKSLSDADGSVIVISIDDSSGTTNSIISLNKADRSGASEVGIAEVGDIDVYDAGADLNEGVTAVSMRGALNDDLLSTVEDSLKDYFFTSVDVNEDGTVFVTEDTAKDVLIVSDDDTVSRAHVGDAFGYSSVHSNSRMLCACNSKNNEVVVSNVDTEEATEISSVRLSGFMLVLLVVVWLSRIYLVLLLLHFVVRGVRQAFVSGDSSHTGGIIAAVFTILAVGSLIGYTSFLTYKESVVTRSREINVFADIIDCRAANLGQYMEQCSKRLLLHDDEKSELAFSNLFMLTDEIDDVFNSATYNGIGTYYYIYGKDDLGVFSLYDSSLETVMGSSGIPSDKRDAIERIFDGEIDDDLHTGRTLRNTSLYRLVAIPDAKGDKTIGVIEFGSKIRSFESRILSNLTENVVVMLVVLFVVYVSYIELRDCGRCMIDYLQLRDVHKKRDAVALLTRPYTFLVTMLISTDSVMSTLIGRSMLEAAGLSTRGLLIALPAVMQGLGLVVGQIAYGSLGWRVGVRRLVCGFCVLLAAGAAFTVGVVIWSNFPLYLVAKFMLGIPFGLLYTLGYSLPRQAEDSEVRTMASGGVRRTDTSAAAMGTILGGFVARYLGNWWVYVLMALVTMLVFVFSMKLFLRHAKPLEKERSGERPGLLALASFLRQRDTIALILLIMLPVILAGGYSSLLFPIYSANLGVSSSTISYMVVLGQLVVYVSIDTIDYLDANYGKWLVGVWAVALLAVVFLTFSLNTSFSWAVVAIALVGVLTKMGDAWKALWAHQASECGVPLGRATGAMFAMRSVLLVVQPILLGALLNVSSRIAAILLGIICLVCVVAFVALTRKSEMRI